MITLIILYVFYIFANIGLADVDANKIKNNETINHTKNALVYLGMLLPAYIIVYSEFKDFIYPAIICLAFLCLRKFVFDTALNILRGLPADYISTKTTSKIDQFTLKIQQKIGYWPFHFIFLALSIGLAFIKI